MITLKPCPFCGGEAEVTTRDVEPQGDQWYGKNIQTFVICTNCGACLFDDYFHDGFADEHEAIAAWNRRAQPENEPLTLEELRQMDGEPVWTTGIGANRNKCYWCLVMVERESVFTVVSDEMTQVGAFCQYGKTWLAYRNKPVKEE